MFLPYRYRYRNIKLSTLSISIPQHQIVYIFGIDIDTNTADGDVTLYTGVCLWDKLWAFQAVPFPRDRHRAAEELHGGRGCVGDEPLAADQAVRSQVRTGDRGAVQRRLLLGAVGKRYHTYYCTALANLLMRHLGIAV